MDTVIEPGPRSGLRVLALLGALVVAALIVGVAVSVDRSPRSFKPGTPEAVVQEYVGHILAGRVPQAAALFTDPERCAAALAQAPSANDTRAHLVNTTLLDNTAYVVIRFETESDSLFIDDSFGWQATFALERAGAEWKLLQAPWPNSMCGVPLSPVRQL